MKHCKWLASLLLVAVVASPVLGADEEKTKKKGNRQNNRLATMMIKNLEPVGLNDEQVKSIQEKGKTVAKELMAINKEGGLNQELMKKRTAAMKEIREANPEMKSGKELNAKVNKAVGLNEQQIAALEKVNTLRATYREQVIAMLTDDQKAKLPRGLTRGAKGNKKGKGKGKKKADAT